MKKKNTPLESNKVNAPISPSIPSTKFGSSSNRLCGESNAQPQPQDKTLTVNTAGDSQRPTWGGELLWCAGPTASMRRTANAFPQPRGLPYAVAEILSHGALQRGFSPFPGGSRDINWASPTFKYFLRTRCISTPAPLPAPVHTEKAAQSLPTA